MRVEFQDFGNAQKLFGVSRREEWKELLEVLEQMPLHIKASDEKGKQGSAVFDPKANNAAIEAALKTKGWLKAGIPEELKFLGKDVDFVKRGVVAEAQFSNYPFALNNIIRTTILMREGMPLLGTNVCGLILITKAKRFPAAQSTLYYEQAVQQITALEKHGIVSIPTRVVGLFEDPGKIQAVWTDYAAARYDRTPAKSLKVRCEMSSLRAAGLSSLTVL